eukprot:jgi/Hompol1/4643/HPOL_003777-RA
MQVAIAALFGFLINYLISISVPAKDVLFCSNVNASVNANGFPLWTIKDDLPTTSSKGYPGASKDTVNHANFALVVSFSDNGPPGAAAFGFNHPCSFWYGETYPNGTGSLYEPAPGVTGNYVRDAAYAAEPVGGWFQTIALGLQTKTIEPNAVTIFQNLQQRSWSVVGYSPDIDPSLIGSKPNVSSVPVIAFANLTAGPVFVSPQDAKTGILGTIPTRFYAEFGSLLKPSITDVNATFVPWYKPVGGDGNALDDAISSAINQVIADIALLDKSALTKGDLSEANEVLLKIGKVLYNLPHGGIYFKKIDHAKKQYALDMNYGTDIRLTGSSNFPLPGARLLLQLTQLTNGILRNSDVAKLGRASITQGLRILPQIQSTGLNLPFGGIIGGVLYPFGISFLLPIFAIILIQEKESRILVMMKMNGMKAFAYYLSHYITFYILYAFSVIVFFITGVAGKLTFFTQTQPALLFLMFFIWGHNQISLAFFFSSLFNRSRFALIIVFVVVLCGVILSLALDSIFLLRDLPSGFFIWPPFAFYRALSVTNRASYTSNVRPLGISDLKSGNEVYTALIFLIVEIPVFLLLAGYLSAVFPSEFGVRKPWHFPITDPIKAYSRASRKRANGGVDPKSEAQLALSVVVDENETRFEDPDVKAERARVDSGNYDPVSPLVIKHMRKVYASRAGAGPKLAVKDATFAVEEGIVFGLLGPNGAGKTTLISILTGLFEASTGIATIGGFDVKADTAEVYKRIGICPQFDILWDDLSVADHLYFYARLKGIHAKDERQAVEQSLANVALTGYNRRLTKGLSGGEKRRLSIAIALLGSPKVVFLDEPTTGLDPEVRRLVWEIVNNAKVGKTVILTTHSMEEAEALCQRIAIMAKGTLRCIANPTRLKQLYGSGYRIMFNAYQEDIDAACAFVESILPTGWTKIDSFATNVSYEFQVSAGQLTKLFKDVESNKDRVGILDWGVGQTTLEDVFVRLISENDADAD